VTLRLRHLIKLGPRPKMVLPDDLEVSFAPMDSIKDGLGGLSALETKPAAEVASGSYNYFEDGDVLLAKVTPCFENGKKALASELENGIGFATSEVHVIRPKPGRIVPSFLLYLLSSEKFRAEGMASMTGAGGLRRVGELSILNHRLAVTDLPTQQTIADFLDRETARIDLLIEKKQRFREMANERWRAALNHVVFPHSPDWGRLPDGWRKVQLKYLTDPKRPIMYGIVLPGPNMEEGPMIVKGGDVKPGRLHPDRLCRTTHEIEASYVRSRLRCGDLVISIRGGIGDIEIVPPEIDGANLTQDAARIAPRQAVDREWLRYALLSSAVFHPLESRSLGAAVRGINIFDLKRVFIPEPPTTQQTEIARKLASMENRLTELRELVKTHADRLREFRAALITAAVTGQIDPETWSRRGTTDRRLDQIEAEMGA